MGCGGHCSCGHNHNQQKPVGGGEPRGTSRFGAVLAGVLVIGLGVVGAAVAFQPSDKPGDKGHAPEAPKQVQPEAKTPQPGTSEASRYVLDHAMKRIDGTEESLKGYEGKVVLMVNVASRCGNTPQYAGLEKLYKDKKDAGLVILGFPANNFREQEPGTNKEIAEFCTSKYGVSFPMFEKISVKGDDAHPLYKQLAAAFKEPDWNFAKYLVDRKGNVVAFYPAKTKPDDKVMMEKIEELLGKK